MSEDTLVNQLQTRLMNLIHEYDNQLTVGEVVGILEFIKWQIISDTGVNNE